MILNNLIPIDIDALFHVDSFSSAQLFHQTIFAEKEFYALEDIHLVIVGVQYIPYTENHTFKNSSLDIIRKELYKLYSPSGEVKILDIGNVKIQETDIETYNALKNIISYLLEKDKKVLILGGSQDITIGQFLAHESVGEKAIKLCVVDENIDMHELKANKIQSDSYLWQILSYQKDILDRYYHLGYQQYLVPEKTIETLHAVNFECVRLGELKNDIKKSEPYLRDANTVSFDIGAIKAADAPGRKNSSPNGFNGEEACQLMRYAGMSNFVSTLGIYEYDAAFDIQNTTAKLIAQMAWYFLEGLMHRKIDIPDDDNLEAQFKKYTVDNENFSQNLVFYKSKITDRWWFEAPNEKNQNLKLKLIACTADEYQQAVHGELPDRWLQIYHKFIL